MKTLNDMTIQEIAAVREGAWAAKDGKTATACPYDCRRANMQQAWLQGFVTDTDEPGTVDRLIFGGVTE